MKIYFFLFILSFASAAFAQPDTRGGVTPLEGLDRVEEEVDAGESPEINYEFSNPSLSNFNNFFKPKPTPRYFSDEKPNEMSMHTANAGFVKHTIDFQPSYLNRDKEVKESYRSNQNLGSLRTSSKKLTIMYRDHEYVDGDRVRIIVNGEVVRENVGLSGNWKGITYELNSGINRFEFEALNQGSSGPNTAAFQITGDKGEVLATDQWNLTTGAKAFLVVVRE